MGALQVPGDGAPILLCAERPTTGGYPIVATVIGADVGLAAHAKPGDTLRFVRVEIEEARAAYRERERALREGVLET
jgi:allophanate hydrolase subunit 2